MFVCHSLGGLIYEDVSYSHYKVHILMGIGSVDGATTAGKAP
jgi:hypothetical protein